MALVLSNSLTIVLVVAIVSAFGYDAIRNQFPNRLILLVIGTVVAFLGHGSFLTWIGSAITGIATADYIAGYIDSSQSS